MNPVTKALPLIAIGVGAVVGVSLLAGSPDDPSGPTVQLCDGETTVALDGQPRTRDEGMAVATELMAEWQRRNPGEDWRLSGPQDPQDPEVVEALMQKRFQLPDPHDNRDLLGEGQSDGHPYRNVSERDLVLWERETRKLVLEGAKIFHDADRLGSTIAVSCDMCHPDASNTHPETYPKYQTQIGRTVLLRHMINWCIEHPLRGEPWEHDDPRMIAVEAYIYAQRKGEALRFGKH